MTQEKLSMRDILSEICTEHGYKYLCLVLKSKNKYLNILNRELKANRPETSKGKCYIVVNDNHKYKYGVHMDGVKEPLFLGDFIDTFNYIRFTLNRKPTPEDIKLSPIEIVEEKEERKPTVDPGTFTLQDWQAIATAVIEDEDWVVEQWKNNFHDIADCPFEDFVAAAKLLEEDPDDALRYLFEAGGSFNGKTSLADLDYTDWKEVAKYGGNQNRDWAEEMLEEYGYETPEELNNKYMRNMRKIVEVKDNF